MTVCEEMQKLREYLDSKNIEYDDDSEEWITGWICRTHFNYKDNFWSVINGLGTYGGFCLDEKQNPGQLELMVNCVNDGEPVGYLKAEDVIKYMEGVTE